MEKVLSYGALGVGAFMALLFILDIAIGFPFGSGPFFVFDVFGLLVAGMVAYLGFNAMKELK